MGPDDECQMAGCTRSAEQTMSFKRHDDVAVCSRHYRRNVAIKYGVLVAISVVLAGAGLGAYWLLL
jgi:hypothetical protein